MVRIHHLREKIVKKIKSTDPQKCWNLIQEEVGKELVDGKFIMVPHLNEASLFELNAVVLKKNKTLLEALTFRRHETVAVNMLQDMIRSDVTSVEGVRLTRPQKINRQFPKDTVVYGSVGNRTVAVRFIGLSLCQTFQLPEEGEIMMDITPYLEDFVTDSLYLVSKVIYAEEFRVRVLFDGSLGEFKVKRKMPVAFQLSKFGLMHQAIIGKYTPVPPERKFRWVRRKGVTIPSTRLAERENRGGGDDGRRQNRPQNIQLGSVLRESEEED